ncbi:hypothetical protein TI05_07180 [Achromatium sp. WMS3]|nr:hypothetical protein TI05_07180 [Achromatium sp. WMS3]
MSEDKQHVFDSSLLDRCAEEPIHLSGAIQSFGTLLAFVNTEVTDGTMELAYYAANAKDFIDKVELGMPLTAIFTEASATTLQDSSTSSFWSENLLTCTGKQFAALIHYTNKVLIVELLAPKSIAETDPLYILGIGLEKILAEKTEAGILQRTLEVVTEIIGFEHLMIYRFGNDWHGEVIAEILENSKAHEAYLGLRFPASDIPPQARRLYYDNRIRLVADVYSQTIPIIGTRETPLDLSQSWLRSVSPVHIQYLRNMNVRASMSISLISENGLWGLIAAHDSRPQSLSLHQRQACNTLGRLVSTRLTLMQQREEQAYLLYHQEAIHAPRHWDATNINHKQILELTKAHGFIGIIDGVEIQIGVLPETDKLNKLLNWLQQKTKIWISSRLIDEYDAALTIKDTASGILWCPISADANSFLLWLRPEELQTVQWAGDPNKPVSIDSATGKEVLSPRNSFAVWEQVVHNQAVEWEAIEIAGARAMQQIAIENLAKRAALIEAEQNGKIEMAASILHDIGNAMIGVTGRASELSRLVQDHEALTQLQRLLSFLQKRQTQLDTGLGSGKGVALINMLSSVIMDIQSTTVEVNAHCDNMTYYVNHVRELLDINRSYAQAGSAASKGTYHLGSLIHDLVTLVIESIGKRGGHLETDIPANLPKLKLDRSSLLRVLINLVKNAYEAVDQVEEKPARVPIIRISAKRQEESLHIKVTDNGIGFVPENAMKLFDRRHSNKKRESGMGLASCQKIINAMGGHLSLQSDGLMCGANAEIYFVEGAFNHE